MESASTGVTLIDGGRKYIAWTQVYDGVRAWDPLAHAYSQSAEVTNFSTYFGSVMSPRATIMMNSEPRFCTDAWDCNNRDKQDWKREGDYLYALYDGSEYYRCDSGHWGISVARSSQVVGSEYLDRLPLSRGIAAVRKTACRK